VVVGWSVFILIAIREASSRRLITPTNLSVSWNNLQWQSVAQLQQIEPKQTDTLPEWEFE
jgi:hypothetical protein